MPYILFVCYFLLTHYSFTLQNVPSICFFFFLSAKNVTHYYGTLLFLYFAAVATAKPNKVIIEEKHFVILPKTNPIHDFIVTTFILRLLWEERSSYLLPSSSYFSFHATWRLFFFLLLYRYGFKNKQTNKWNVIRQ